MHNSQIRRDFVSESGVYEPCKFDLLTLLAMALPCLWPLIRNVKLGTLSANNSRRADLLANPFGYVSLAWMTTMDERHIEPYLSIQRSENHRNLDPSESETSHIAQKSEEKT